LGHAVSGQKRSVSVYAKHGGVAADAGLKLRE
jgi:hypothetical protein